MPRRWYVELAVAVAAVGGVATGTVLAFDDGRGRSPSRAEYLARVRTVCVRYGRQLDLVPPPADIAAPGEVVSSVGVALPILERQELAIRALVPPRALEQPLRSFFALTDRSIGGLRAALRGAYARDLGAMGRGELQFAVARDQAKVIAHRIGFRC